VEVTEMRYVDYISGIAFRFFRPESRLPFSNEFYEKRLKRILRTGTVGIAEKMGTALEFWNTRLPEDDAGMKRSLRDICRIPRMSTLAVAGMINRGVREMHAGEAFVNVGVWHGFTFLSGIINNPGKRCIAIDNFSQFGGPKQDFLTRFEKLRSGQHLFYELDCFEYFAHHHSGSIGFYIYDGEHSYESQLRGLKAAEPFFSPHCIILVDDTNWPEPRSATLDFVAQSTHRYEIVLDITTSHNCHPTVWNGVLVLQRVP
jgi:hypothetical protein